MIIAEASLQHGGKAGDAIQICRHVRRLGADAVKFQMFVPGEPLFCPLEGDDKRWPKWGVSMMPVQDWQNVKRYCDEIGIIFMASVFQHSAVELYKSLNPQWWKVASRAAKTFPYEKASGPFIISTGLFMPNPPGKVRFLQCRTEYPHSPVRWERGDGLSDHSGSSWPAIDALAHQPNAIIEVHVDFGRGKKLPEEITLSELKLICEARDAFAAMRKS